MGIFPGRRKSAEETAGPAGPEDERGAKVRALKPQERLSTVIKESTPHSAMEAIRENERFLIEGGAAGVVLLLDVFDIGGLSKKHSKDEDKGGIASQIGADHIRVVVSEQMLEDQYIGIIPDFGRRLSTVRSRAIQIIMVCQSLPQLQNRYPNNLWAELLGNADTQIMLGATDDVSAEYFSARSGDMTVEVNSTMTTRQSLALAQVIPQYRYTEGIGRRRVLTPDEVLRMPNDELLIIIRGQKILKAKKFDFIAHPYAKECVRCRIQEYKSHPARQAAQSEPVGPQVPEEPVPTEASAPKPEQKAADSKPESKDPPPASQPSELPSKPARRPTTLYESSRPPVDF